MSYQDIEVVHVVAMDRQHAIGKNNQLPWHIREDLQHFKRITEQGVVIMGRKTLQSMGRALSNRVNWVITRDTTWHAANTKVAHTLEDALQQACWDVERTPKPSLFIIGGGEIFAQTLPFTDRLEITRVALDVNGDTFYPKIPSEFDLVQSVDQVNAEGIAYSFQQYLRR